MLQPEALPRMNKFARTDEELTAALRRHVDLLSGYYIQCFRNGDSKYFGEVAGKLRLLVCDKKNNPALLLYLARQYGVEHRYRISSDGKITDMGEDQTLVEYLAREDLRVRVEDEMVAVSTRLEILYYAEKEGAAHEDLVHPEILYRMKLPKFTLNGVTGYQEKIESTARYVIEIGRRVLNDIQRLRA